MFLDKALPFTYIFRKIKTDLFYVLIVGVVVYYVTTKFSHKIPVMPPNVPTFLGTAISILLSFKIGQSYDRWWEARKVWGAIVNDARSFVVQLQTFLTGDSNDAVKRMAYRQIAWCYMLGQSLRGSDPLENMDKYMSEEDIKAVTRHSNKALAVLQLTALELRQHRAQDTVDQFAHIQIDNTLVRLCDAMGKAERINSTVFPVTYRLFLHFAIYLFVVVLSISLKDVSALYEIPLLILISSIFFLLEKTAYHLQDPFRNRPSDVPVTTIARNIEINIRQLLGEQDVPEPLKPQGFYVL